MTKVDHQRLAGDILEGVGGEANISGLAHCATRLRLQIRDNDLVDDAAVQDLPGVVTTVNAGGQYQIVIGNDVPKVYAGLGALTNLTGDTPQTEDEGPKGNLFDRFIRLISSVFTPILWTMAGLGLFKAFLVLAVQLGAANPESTTYLILNAASDGFFYFLPLFLAVTAARRFDANQFNSMAIAAALVYPSVVALTEATERVTFLGIPVVVMSYASSVIPIIVAVWVQGYLERFFNKILPDWLRNFTTPMLTVIIMVPLVLLTVGPVTMLVAQWLSDGVTFLLSAVPWLGGAIMGGFWQVFVMFGVHWAFIAVIINDLGTQGFSVIPAPLMAAVLAQAAATFAVLLRSRSAKRREVAGPATISGFLAGITEPAIYGVNLPLKLPFYFGLVGGAVGGAIIGLGGLAASDFVFPSLLAYPAFLTYGKFSFMVIGTIAAILIGFFLTFFFGPREQSDDEPAKDGRVAGIPDSASEADTVKAVDQENMKLATAVATSIGAPVSGVTVPLKDVNDKVFSSGAMGPGYGIKPNEGTFVSPLDGEVVVAMKTGHAFGIKGDDGVEVLVHIGLDTVQLDGKHFASKVKKGQKVKKGDVLAEVDLDGVTAEGFDTTTVVLVTNAKALSEVITSAPGSVAPGASTMLATK